jgi:hypothetical protein
MKKIGKMAKSEGLQLEELRKLTRPSRRFINRFPTDTVLLKWLPS